MSRRTREIGIRIALGADARQIVLAIFSRAIAQVALGVAAGGGLVFALTKLINGLAAKEILAVVGYMALMMAVCLLACLVPTAARCACNRPKRCGPNSQRGRVTVSRQHRPRASTKNTEFPAARKSLISRLVV